MTCLTCCHVHHTKPCAATQTEQHNTLPSKTMLPVKHLLIVDLTADINPPCHQILLGCLHLATRSIHFFGSMRHTGCCPDGPTPAMPLPPEAGHAKFHCQTLVCCCTCQISNFNAVNTSDTTVASNHLKICCKLLLTHLTSALALTSCSSFLLVMLTPLMARIAETG